MVYYERFIGIIRLEDIIIIPEYFQAKAIPFLLIERKNRFDQLFFRKPNWTFRAHWKSIRMISCSLNIPYTNWTLWWEPELVESAENIALKNNYQDALRLTLGEDERFLIILVRNHR